jgi:hypothetical protein
MRISHTYRALVVVFALLTGGSDAFAVVGRPLTPMSYAGVARRTTRRAAYYSGVPGSLGPVAVSGDGRAPLAGGVT